MRKMRKFNDGGSADAEEAKYKAAGLAASNAENKSSSGFFGRLGEGNIDQKGSVAYEKYGAGYGRKLEAEKAAKAPEAAAPAPAPTAKAKAPEAADTQRTGREEDAADTQRTGREEDAAVDTKRTGREEDAAVKTTAPAPRDNKPGESAEAIAASKVDRAPAPAAKPAAKTAPAKPGESAEAIAASKVDRAPAPAAKPAAKTAPAKPAAKTAPAKPAAKTAPAAEPKIQRARLDVPNATGPRSAGNPMSTDPSQRPKLKYQSLQDREKENAAKRKESGVGMYGTTKSEEGPRRGVTKINPEDFKKQPKGMGTLTFAKGGFASSRADGIAQRGKTRGRMC